MAYYGERLADGFEMINGQPEINIRLDCLRAPREMEIISALRDSADEPHNEPLNEFEPHNEPLSVDGDPGIRDLVFTYVFYSGVGS